MYKRKKKWTNAWFGIPEHKGPLKNEELILNFKQNKREMRLFSKKKRRGKKKKIFYHNEKKAFQSFLCMIGAGLYTCTKNVKNFHSIQVSGFCGRPTYQERIQESQWKKDQLNS